MRDKGQHDGEQGKGTLLTFQKIMEKGSYSVQQQMLKNIWN